MRFLVVDDSKVARKKITAFIEELGYSVIGEATNGDEACKMSKELNPTHITMDLEMPLKSGSDATKEILAQNSEIVIIGISSSFNNKELRDSMRNGMKKILTKPVSFELFKETIEAYKVEI